MKIVYFYIRKKFHLFDNFFKYKISYTVYESQYLILPKCICVNAFVFRLAKSFRIIRYKF